MTPQELLKPRYKIIADFPLNDRYPVGKIITVVTESYAISDNGYPVFYCDFEEYPAIFKKLEWWEDRAADDMPEYVKEDGGMVYLAKWKRPDTHYPIKMILYEANGELQCGEYYVGNKTMCFYEPATEAEYNDYIKSKQSA